jgi:transcription elongation factor GreA
MAQPSEHDTIWLTDDAHEKLAAELADLTGPVRQEIIARITAAREEGDLKENGGYHAAKDEQGKIEARIRQIEEIMRRAEVGQPDDDGTVSPGMKVTYRFVGDAEAQSFLLGAREIEDDQIEVFSPQSPLGAAILGAREGDTVAFTAPSGKELQVEVIEAVPYTG